jgi:HD-GYP domain-containing protein (c-di-GMP phosphodiesterase class II)
LVGEEAFLQVVVPITGPQQQINGWFEGVYHLTPQTMAAVTSDVLSITGLAMAAVVVTALILYPIMAHQQRLVVAKAQDSIRANMETLKVLGSAIAKRDSDTHNHNFRVTVYAVRTAEAMGLPAGMIRSLAKGAFLHDIGKIAIPDHILLKPGRLTEDEFVIMRGHVEHGLDIIRSSSWLADGDAVVASHHEKVNGSGYPRAMKGDSIPIIARIFAVADVFDALTSARPYKEPIPLDQAIAILQKDAGAHFDRGVLEVFLGVLPDLYPLIGGREDGTPERELDTLMERYFGLASAA